MTFHLDTKEAGSLKFTIKVGAEQIQNKDRAGTQPPSFISRLFPARSSRADVEVDKQSLIGETNPYVYGHFIEHLERCIYGIICTEEGSKLREETLVLIKDLCPPVIRYPGGNIASGYHWEDGIGAKEERPRRFYQAWNA